MRTWAAGAALASLVALSPNAAPAGTATLNGGQAIYTANLGETNNVSVTEAAGIVTFTDTAGVTAGLGFIQVTPTQATAGGVATSVVVLADNMNDDIDATGLTTLQGDLDGGSGDDSILGGPLGDILRGGSGNDFLLGNQGNDVMQGGDGDDEFEWENGDGADDISGEAGVDEFVFEGADGGNDAVTLGPAANSPSFEIDLVRTAPTAFTIEIGSIEILTIDGLAGDDNIAFNFTAAQFSATSVQSVDLSGSDGDDTLLGSPLAETIDGGPGNDFIQGNRGDDIMIGGDGDDDFVWNNGDGADDIFGDAGGDLFTFNGSTGATGDDVLLRQGTTLDVDLERFAPTAFVIETENIEEIEVNGLAGNDLLTVNDLSFSPTLAQVTFSGGDGDDMLDALATAATPLIDGFGDAGSDLLLGGASDDLLNGGAGDDVIDGGANNDFMLVGGDDNDLIFGGAGAETLDGGNGNDELVGGPGADTMNGGDGDDRMVWNNGDGTDIMEGGLGLDVAEVNGSPTADDMFQASANAARLTFQRLSPGPFSLDIGTTEFVDFAGLAGSETLTVMDLTGVADLVEIAADGASGDENFNASAQLNNAIAMNFLGGDGDDDLLGGSGVDTLAGGNGADLVQGNRGVDFMFGDAGDDRLIWNNGDGNDDILGGADADVFEFNGANGAGDVLTLDASNNGGLGFEIDLNRTAPTVLDIEVGECETFEINGLDGDDNMSGAGIPAGTSLTAMLMTGGNGNDTLIGSRAVDTINGGPGNDFIQGNQAADFMNGDDGDDTLVWNNGDGPDFISGNADNDIFQFNGSSTGGDVVEVRPGGSEVQLERFAPTAFVIDINTCENFDIAGLGGNDNLVALDLSGTTVVDLDFFGNDGDDTLDGTALVAAGPGFVAQGGNGNDTLLGGAGDDALLGGDGDDFIQGNRGADFMIGDDAAPGPLGDDRLVWNNGDGPDSILGGDDFFGDTFEFNGADPAGDVISLVAPSGNPSFEVDLVRTAPTAFTIEFGEIEIVDVNLLGGDDTLTVGDMTTTSVFQVDFDGAAGNDMLNASGQLDNSTSVNALGGDGDDSLTGGAGFDNLEGGPGNDFFDGNGDGDQMFGDDGDDSFIWNNGDGPDFVSGDNGTDDFVFNGSNGATGDDVTVRTGGIFAEVELERVSPTAFFIDIDFVELLTLNGLNGDDALTLDGLGGTSVTDATLNGNAGNDTLDATTLASSVSLLADGGDGNDDIFGGAAADTLLGGAGDDFIDGNQGADDMQGGDGGDTIIWNNGDGPDLISGNAGFDAFEFNGSNGATGDDVEVRPGGSEVQLERFAPTAFVIDINTTELVSVNGLGGADNLRFADVTGTSITDAELIGGDADDVLDLSAVPSTVLGFMLGQGGDDQLLGGGGDDLMDGGDGRDFLQGNRGADLMLGEQGVDAFVWNNGDGPDSIIGGTEFDTFQFNGADGGNDDILLGAAGFEAELERFAPTAFVISIEETERIDLNALAGDDTVAVGDFTGTFIEELHFDGAAGADSLDGTGQLNPDAFITALGGTEADTLIGGAGDDLLLGNQGADIMAGNGGDDTMIWNNGDGTDVMDGDAGSDLVRVNGSPTAGDVFQVSPNAPRLTFQRVSPGPFSLDIATVEALQVFGLDGDDSLTFNDLVGVADLNSVLVHGDNGNDTLDASALTVASVAFEGFGGPGDDILIGGPNADRLEGGLGLDDIRGGASDDLLVGGAGGFLVANEASNSVTRYDAESGSFMNALIGDVAVPRPGKQVLGKGGRATGGPDAFGYRFTDSNEVGGPAFNFEDISGTGTALTLTDDAFSLQTLPFAFNFYGTDFTDVRVSSNGYLTFGTDGTDFTNDSITNATDPNNLIALFWDDLNPALGGTIHVQTLGTSPNQRFIAQYSNVPHASTATPSGAFQAKLFEGSNNIEFHYAIAVSDNTGSFGDNPEYTIGIENFDASVGLQYAFGTAGLNALAVLFTTQAPPPTGLTGGPDAFGYTFADSNVTGGPAVNFEDISGTGTALTLGDDDSTQVAMGFPFNFYGNDFTDVFVASNGFLSFNAAGTTGFGGPGNANTNLAIPTASAPNDLIALFWDDLNPGAGGTIHHQTLGTSPNQRFIIQFTSVPHFAAGTSGIYQAKLFEGSNNIEFHYQTALGHAAGGSGDGPEHTIGIENGAGAVGLQYAFEVADLATPLAIRFSAPAVMAPEDDNPLDTPDDVVFGPDGDLYVSDFATGIVARFDGESGAFLDVFVDAAGGVGSAGGLTFGPDGNLYVTSVTNNSVMRFDGTTGQFLGTFASGGGMAGPADLAFGPDGNLYVAGLFSNAVYRFNGTSGALIGQIDPANLSGGLLFPTSVAFDAAGNLYVGDAGNSRVAAYDIVSGAFGGNFTADLGGGQPSGLAFGPDGSLYVTVQGTNEVRRFAADGSLIKVVVPAGSTLNTPFGIAFAPEDDSPDTLVGNPGADLMFGEGGDDLLVWNNGDGSDFMEGGFGALDEVEVNGSPSGDDLFQGSPNGDRTLFERISPGPFALDIGTTERLSVNTLGGNDIVDLNGLTAPLPVLFADGGDGDDVLLGSPGDDSLLGGAGGDILQGNQGADLMDGGPGGDLIIWFNGDGPDDVIGGADDDLFDFNGSAGGSDFINLNLGSGSFEVALVRTLPSAFTIDIATVETLDIDTFDGDNTVIVADLSSTSVEDIILTGGTGDDLFDASAIPSGGPNADMTGGDGNDNLFGTGNAETIDAGNGNDFLDGGPGNDALLGQAGDDVLVWNNGDGSDDMVGGPDNDEVRVNGSGGSGDQFRVFTDGLGGLFFERQNLGLFSLDLFQVEALSVNGLGGDDTLNVENLTGVLDLELVTLDGGPGNDVLDASGITLATVALRGFGGDGDDQLLGGALADHFEGGTGNDTLQGAGGDDFLVGDAGGFVASNFANISRFEGESGGFINAFIANPAGFPLDVEYGPQGGLYVSDGFEIVQYNGQTGVIRDNPFISAANVDSPTGMTFGPDGLLYVLAGSPQEVARYDAITGAFVDVFVAPGAFDTATDLAFSPEGHLVVVDSGDGHVHAFDANGLPLGDVDFSGAGGLDEPFDLAFGPDGALYVSDNGNERVVRHDGSAASVFADEFDPGVGPLGLGFGGDGSLFAIAGNTGSGGDEIRRFDSATGDLLGAVASAPDVDDALHLAFAPLGGETDNDDITPGPGADTVFAGADDDLVTWNNGDGSDFIEGGLGVDTVEVNGSTSAVNGDQFAASPNGDRILFERTTPGPFTLDIGTSEFIDVNSLDGNDVIDFSAIADEIALSADGGAGDDIIRGTQITDTTLVGGPGDDQIFGNDGDETFLYVDGDGNDLLEGGNGLDTLVVSGADDAMTGDLFAATPNGPGRLLFSRSNLVAYTLDLGSIEVADVSGLAGDDTIDFEAITAETSLIARGGAGNDTIRGTQVSDSMLIGGPGADQIFGNAGEETIIWNNGDGSDLIEGGADFDTVVVNGSSSAGDVFEVRPNGARLQFMRVMPGPFTLDIGTSERLETNGGDGDDMLTVFDLTGVLDLAEVELSGDAGNDTINASGLLAGVTLTLFGGSGDDSLTGGAGADDLFGGDGNDTVVGFRGADDMFGEAGDDLLVWNNGDGSDVFEGGDGFDTAQANGSGTAGDSFVAQANGARLHFERVNLGPFTLDIGTSEVLDVNSGGGADNVVISNLTGVADLVAVDLDGGDGDDLLDGSGLTAATPLSALGGAGNDTLRGGAGDDLLDGGDGNDFLLGNRGADDLRGDLGDDRFVWNNGDGSDLIEGGDGSDTSEVNADPTQADFFFVLASGARVEVQRVNPTAFALDHGTVEILDLRTLGGSDTVIVDNVAASTLTELNVETGDGEDFANASALAGSFLTAMGGSGDDILTGGSGADTLIGGPGSDDMIGNAGNDTLVWNDGDGSDFIEGGDGGDTLEVNGSASTGDLFEVSANGARVSFARVNFGFFTLDAGTIETLEVSGSNGDDELTLNDLTGTGLVDVVYSGGSGNDRSTLNASAGDDVFDISELETTLGGLTLAYASDVENVDANGLDGDDLFMVTASRFAKITVDGGAHVLGDSLDLDAEELVVTAQTSSSVTLRDRQPVCYFNIEFFDLLNIGIASSGVVIR